MSKIKNFRELRFYQNALSSSKRVFEITKKFPREEKYSLVSQIRRSSRSVCANLAEVWRKRPYRAHFVSKLTDCAGESDETRVWLEISWRFGYIDKKEFDELDSKYDLISGQLVSMMVSPDKWII